ncbi:hypothetical protein K2173_007449 [Erythroxylum novogranatense]|uniref:Uncharacterized protein n=1 Tax=Erythroxylum novogranatense TaxID=1862640 RepID=A0AAV8T687_9ROSI|nr:hypothetical protein K2173_007449 [Erythroxylum novogranatense]
MVGIPLWKSKFVETILEQQIVSLGLVVLFRGSPLGKSKFVDDDKSKRNNLPFQYLLQCHTHTAAWR